MKAVFLIALLLLAGCGEKVNSEHVDEFALCTREAGATMYGAYWCSHCQEQKKMFGDSFNLVKYVECDPNGENSQATLCVEKGIAGYPTWVFADESRLTGARSFEDLAEKTGCTLP